MLVKIARYYSFPNLVQQTPQKSFVWKDFTFTEDDVDECDYLVILDHPKHDFSVKVHPANIIHLASEPPNENSKYRHYANSNAAIIYNQLNIKSQSVLSHGALPWHLDKDYDFLKILDVGDLETFKQNKIAWITSNQRGTKGHSKRMNFLDSITKLDFVDCYGRGIKPVDDKFEVLKNYKYAIAYENFVNDFYWTEKIVDCFLSFSMPLYVGSNSIDNFFPKNSFIQIDPADKHINLYLKEIVNSKKWEDNLNDIAHARDLILDQYQLFPFLYNQIQSLVSVNGVFKKENKQQMFFKGGNEYFDNYPLRLDFTKYLLKAQIKISKFLK